MQTIDFELAKWLKEHGIKQGRDFYYINNKYVVWDPEHEDAICSAFTLCEILEMLPTFLPDDRRFVFYRGVNDYCSYYDGQCVNEFRHKNPAQAAGLLLKWCIENGYVKPEEGG